MSRRLTDSTNRGRRGRPCPIALSFSNPNREPLADRLARGRITQAQYLAAQEFRKHYGLAAGKMLTGSAVVHDMLINAMSAKEVAASRGLTGALGMPTLAVIYGFSDGRRD